MTSLDPHFKVAYRFGAIFLAEPYPGGPGRPDHAIALLERGIERDDGRWEYMEDIGFVYYWWLTDFQQAAEWFKRAGEQPGAPTWLAPLAATTLAQGGNREHRGCCGRSWRTPNSTGCAAMRPSGCSSSTRWIRSRS